MMSVKKERVVVKEGHNVHVIRVWQRDEAKAASNSHSVVVQLGPTEKGEIVKKHCAVSGCEALVGCQVNQMSHGPTGISSLIQYARS